MGEVLRDVLIVSIHWFSNILIFLIFARVILTWFPEPRSDGPLRQLYHSLLSVAHFMTDPITGPIRNLIHKSPLGGPGMVLDFSPIISFFLIRLVRDLLMQIVWFIF